MAICKINMQKSNSYRFALSAFLLLFFPVALKAQFPVHFQANQPQELKAHAGSHVHAPQGATVTLGGSPSASGGTAPYSYLWKPPDNLDDTTVAYPQLTVDTLDQYKLKVTDQQLCTAYDSINVTLETGITEQKKTNNPFAVYPNPIEGKQLTIQAHKGAKPFTVTLITTSGKEIAQYEFPGEGTHHIAINQSLSGKMLLLKVHEESTYLFKIMHK